MLRLKMKASGWREWASPKCVGQHIGARYTLYEFLNELINTRHQATSSHVSQMLIVRGGNLLKSICWHQLKVVYTAKTTAEVLACKSSRLTQHMCSSSAHSKRSWLMPKSLHLPYVSSCELLEWVQCSLMPIERIKTWYIMTLWGCVLITCVTLQVIRNEC